MKKFPVKATIIETGTVFLVTMIDFDNECVFRTIAQNGDGKWFDFDEVIIEFDGKKYRNFPEGSNVDLTDLKWGDFITIYFNEEGNEISEMGSIEFINYEAKTFILRHMNDKNNPSVRIMNEWIRIKKH